VALLAMTLFLVPMASYYAVDHHGLGTRMADATRDLDLRAMILDTALKQAILAPGFLMEAHPVPAEPHLVESSIARVFRLNEIIGRLGLHPEGSPSILFDRNAFTARPGLPAVPVPGGQSQARHGSLSVRGGPMVSFDDGEISVTQAMEIHRSTGQPGFWGNASAVVSMKDLRKFLRLDEMAEQGYAVSLAYHTRAVGDGKIMISAGGMQRNDPVQREIGLPGGDRIVFVVSPPASWNPPPVALPELFALLLGSAVVGVLTYLLLRRSVEMQEQVALQTLQLALDKEVMESDFERVRQTELQLQNSHAVLDSIFEHIPNMIILKRASDLKVVRVNQLGETVLGQPNSLLVGRSSADLFGDEDARQDGETDRAAIENGGLVELPEQFIQRPGGSARWVKIKKLALFGADGVPSHILEIGEDITAHKHLDEALTENLNFVEQLLAAVPTPVFFKDIDGRYIGVNKAFEEFYGTSAEAMIGKTVFDIAPPHLAEIYDEADRELLASGGKQTYEARVRCADGVEKDVVFFKAVFSTTHSEAGGIVGIMLDISERKAGERHILRLNRTLAVVSETNHAILRATDCPTLIQETVDILHRTGGFPLAWAYATRCEMPEMVVTGEHHEFASAVRAFLAQGQETRGADDVPGDVLSCKFYGALSELGGSLVKLPPGFEGNGLAHLPLQVAGQLAGGICIVGTGEELRDAEEQVLLASLAQNLSHAIDSLEQEKARQVAERKLELASHVFENSAEGVMITDSNNRILMVNRRFSEITGYSAEEVTGHTPNMLNSGQQDQSFYSNMWRSLTNRGEWHGEIRNRRKDGEVIVEWLNISAVKNDLGEIINFVAVFSEITVHKTIKKRMQFLAHYDALTSLPNRILFSDRLEQSIIGARRNSRSMALMFIDLDRFDQINKTVGHASGDMLLREVATRLLAAVDPGYSVSRLGGDEFAIVLTDIDSPDHAVAAARQVQKELSRAIYIGDAELHISASIGISVFPRDGADAESLTKSADAAMYLAAEAGGDCFRLSQANGVPSEHAWLRERLQRAIERDELRVFYQPLLSCETGRIVGAEALLRWFRPEAGFVSPDIFVPMLEESGLLVRVGDHVLRDAMENNIAWRRKFDSELFVAVNLCGGQMADAKAVDKVAATMKELGFESRYLHLEMQENTLMRDAPAGLAFLHRLKDLGVTLAIDDFGTGYSSLSYLNRFPIAALKIDRSFIQDTPNDAEAVAITRTIIAMGHALELKIVAEGVETPAQVDFLRKAGCDVLQGYRFSEAVSAEEFSTLLAENGLGGFAFAEPQPSERLHLVS
jgi:diguanylate cyclase (GGDEF)-like protein/PAS domain S-box-containing protein